MKKLGIKDFFDARNVNFSGFSSETGLSISVVFHKAIIHVFEDGNEAAAATEVNLYEESDLVNELLPEFKADHPFILLIREK